MDSSGDIKINLPLAVFLFLLMLCLTISNVILIRNNRAVTVIASRKIKSLAPEVGITEHQLGGVDLSGHPISIRLDDKSKKTLVLVFSPVCGICKINWPNWDRLVSSIDRSKVRVIVVNTYYELPPEYADLHRLAQFITISSLNTESQTNWNFNATPITVELNEDGRIDGVWTGVIDAGRTKAVQRLLGL